jgi:hypothetical protein
MVDAAAREEVSQRGLRGGELARGGVYAFVISRVKSAWAEATVETHSTLLAPAAFS